MSSLLESLHLDVEAHPELYDAIAKSIKTRTVPKGTILQEPGDIILNSFYVNKGLLRTYTIDAKGKVHIFMFAPEGWIAGDIESHATEQPAQLYVEAIEDSEIEVISRSNLSKIGDEVSLSRVVDTLMRRIGVLQRRIILMMSATALERYEHFQQTYPSVVNRVPQHMIASYLGITPEALSKIKSEALKR